MKLIFKLFFLYFIIVVLVFQLRPLGAMNWIVEQGMYALTVAFVVVSAFLALRTYGHGPRFRSLLCFTTGFSSWFIAEVTFMYYDYIVKNLPYPSPADYFFLAGYILLFFGILFEVNAAHIVWKKINKKIYALAGIFSSIIFIFLSYLIVFVAYDPQVSLGENIVTIGYTVGDMFIIVGLFFLIIMSWEYRGGKAAKIWMSLFVGFLVGTFADIIYAVFTDEFAKHQGFIYVLSQCCYILGYLFMAYSFLYLKSIFLSFQKKALE